jgi:hypothetical protein
MHGLKGFPITPLREDTIGKRYGNDPKPYIPTGSGDIQPHLAVFIWEAGALGVCRLGALTFKFWRNNNDEII